MAAMHVLGKVRERPASREREHLRLAGGNGQGSGAPAWAAALAGRPGGFAIPPRLSPHHSLPPPLHVARGPRASCEFGPWRRLAAGKVQTASSARFVMDGVIEGSRNESRVCTFQLLDSRFDWRIIPVRFPRRHLWIPALALCAALLGGCGHAPTAPVGSETQSQTQTAPASTAVA